MKNGYLAKLAWIAVFISNVENPGADDPCGQS